MQGELGLTPVAQSRSKENSTGLEASSLPPPSSLQKSLKPATLEEALFYQVYSNKGTLLP